MRRRLAYLMRFCRLGSAFIFSRSSSPSLSTSTRLSSSLMASAPISARNCPAIFVLQLAVFFLGQHLAFLDAGNLAGIDDHEGLEVENALEIAHGNVQQVADARGQALEEPDVRAGRSQLDVAEALAADFAERDFDAALVADDAAVLHALVLAAEALPVGDGAENLGAEQAVAFGLEGAVVDGLRLGDFAVRPGPDFFRARQADANGIEIGDQTGTIIRAASIQGRFLPAAAFAAALPVARERKTFQIPVSSATAA